MRTGGYLTGLVVMAAMIGPVAAQQGVGAKPGQPAGNSTTQPSKDDVEAIRSLADTFTKAFNAGDAKAVAALYTPDAHMVDPAGEVVEGRRAIEEEYAALFRENPGLKIEIHVDSIRSIGSDAAVEDGSSRVTPKGESTSVVNQYTVIYSKRDGKWLQASVRETSSDSVTPHERLKELEWMLGDWVDEAHDAVTLSNCHWSPDKNFLVRDFSIKSRGHVGLTGTQRIGWDPKTRQIKSWVFDSEGGHGEGLWARLGNQWVIKATGVLQDGRVATATHILTREGKETCRWRTVDRTIGGNVVPNPDEFVMVRRPPAPGAR
jgi:uncharacterized protein (TIGR02246 family)